MSLQPKRRKVLGRWRRITFIVWVTLTIVAATYLALAAILNVPLGLDQIVVGGAIPPLMIVLLVLGLGWALLLVASKKR